MGLFCSLSCLEELFSETRLPVYDFLGMRTYVTPFCNLGRDPPPPASMAASAPTVRGSFLEIYATQLIDVLGAYCLLSVVYDWSTLRARRSVRVLFCVLIRVKHDRSRDRG
jgi:hypothetical protein